MKTRHTLVLLVVLALTFALLTATASSARNAVMFSSGTDASGQVALKDGDGGDDDRWGDVEPGGDDDGDVPEPPEEGGGEGEGEGEGEGGNSTGRQLSLRLASFYAQFHRALLNLKYMLATL